ncbi:MAG: YbhB/YbcL family Raf kinase inhibitor-like protein [Methanobacterium sp.]|nr:YbhB/YbcL family Raf kinase inhibitor-like protein [Methanobacterium sp.]
MIWGLFVLVLVIFVSGCTSQNTNQTTGTNQTTVNSGNFEIKSNAFVQGGQIPQKYTANGQNISPPLSWASAPVNTKSFTITCEDPDASGSGGGAFFHWIIFNIPGNVNQLAEGITNQGTLDNGAKQGTNDFNKIGYSGPAPPSGTHRYAFKIYALDTTLNLDVGATKNQVNSAIQGHILGEAQITGKYGV